MSHAVGVGRASAQTEGRKGVSMDRDQDTMTDRDQLQDRHSTMDSTTGSNYQTTESTTVVEAIPGSNYQSTDANYQSTDANYQTTDSSYQQESSYQTDSIVTGDDDGGEQGKEAMGAGAG